MYSPTTAGETNDLSNEFQLKGNGVMKTAAGEVDALRKRALRNTIVTSTTGALEGKVTERNGAGRWDYQTSCVAGEVGSLPPQQETAANPTAAIKNSSVINGQQAETGKSMDIANSRRSLMVDHAAHAVFEHFHLDPWCRSNSSGSSVACMLKLKVSVSQPDDTAAVASRKCRGQRHNNSRERMTHDRTQTFNPSLRPSHCSMMEKEDTRRVPVLANYETSVYLLFTPLSHTLIGLESPRT
ncbi:hypothetical protein WN55_08244 [Dufourea novaeangliae]|uniref:Uncharacterized protein n=1 Tax=Dufourea novaeangliae TaxID=178035 RepID=A0A154P6M1_DUFNO|nr:hypothetical protein WN55_08244 [Dufourea novaeangliae]